MAVSLLEAVSKLESADTLVQSLICSTAQTAHGKQQIGKHDFN